MIDVIAVNSQHTGVQRFTGAHGMKLQIARPTKVMSHPVETGASQSDHRIILPVEAQLMVMLTGETYKNVYRQFENAFLAAELLVLQTRARTFANMIISAMPHEETPENMQSVQMLVTLTEVQFFKTQYSAKMARSTSTRSRDTTRRGEQSPSSKPSVAYSIFAK